MTTTKLQSLEKTLWITAVIIVGLFLGLSVQAQLGPDDTGANTGNTGQAGSDPQNFDRSGNDDNFPRPPADIIGSGSADDDDHDCDAKIGDRVWNDQNKNGVQDAGEPGISGVTMKVIDGNDTDRKTTGTDGSYKFKNLCNKVTVIVAAETLPAGCYQTYDRDGKLDHSYKRDLDDDESYKKADFGYHCPTSSQPKLSPQTGAGETNLGVIIGLLGAASTGTFLLMTGKHREA